jgi:hypothetical protein
MLAFVVTAHIHRSIPEHCIIGGIGGIGVGGGGAFFNAGEGVVGLAAATLVLGGFAGGVR